MGLDEWLLIIDKYGLPLVALIVLMIWLTPKLNDLWEKVFPKQQTKPKINVEELFRNDQEVQKILVEIVHDLDVNWATVWQFHNGSMTLNGVPFLKVSATHSECRKGCPSHADQYQRLSTSLLGDLSILLTESCVRLTPDNPHYPAITNSMKSNGVRTTYARPMFNAHNSLIGVLTASFREDVILSDKDIDALGEYSSRIVIFLDRMSKLSGKPSGSTDIYSTRY